MNEMKKDGEFYKIAILDAGSQYGGLIDRIVREAGYRTEILDLDTSTEKLEHYNGIIISGGPNSVYADDAPDCDPGLFKLGKPVLGICYGMQLLAKHLGGKIEPTARREDGPQDTVFSDNSRLFAGLAGKQRVLMSHGDSVTKLPPGFSKTGESEGIISAIENEDSQLYGVQFHPEVYQTEGGEQIFKNFLEGIAGLNSDYTAEDQEAEAIDYINKVVGEREVLLFLSGGVDSSVLAALMAKAIEDKDRLHAVHINTGFMRQGESELVVEALKQAGIEVEMVDAKETFYQGTTVIDGQETSKLDQVTDPQVKRKIIGDTFIKVRDQVVRELNLPADVVLAQGSLRPDLIESGSHLASKQADVIKTHHNDTDAVRALRDKGQVVEPLQALYKDQVRAIGRRLGLPGSLVERHPFPGPGLAVRILCIAGDLEVVRELQEEAGQLQITVNEALAENKLQEYSARVLPIRSVGVQGDGRSYKPPVSISGSADWTRLTNLAEILPKKVHGINRVCYELTDSEPGNLSATPTYLTEDAIDQERQADAIVSEVLHKYDAFKDISQMPVVLLPVSFGRAGERAIVLRPFMSPDFMTGVAATPGKELPEVAVFEMAKRIIKEVPGISKVLYDLTSKPPGTTEWE